MRLIEPPRDRTRDREVDSPKVKLCSRITFVIFFSFCRHMSVECCKISYILSIYLQFLQVYFSRIF